MPAPWIRRHDHFEQLASTSTYLAELWRNSDLDPDETPIIVTADQQTAGRGRGDHRWYSDKGSLTFTLGLRPEEFQLSLANLIPIGLLSAYCMIETINQIWPDPSLKLGIRWPNDIECDRGKIGGILPECIIQDRRGMLVLIGIGMNLSTDLSQGPSDARLIGASLQDVRRDENHDPHHLPDLKKRLLKQFLERFPEDLSRLGDPQNTWIPEAQKYDRLLDEKVEIRQGQDLTIKGVAVGWDLAGRLLIKTNEDQIIAVSSGQVLRNLPPQFG